MSHVVAVTEYAFAIKRQLEYVNEHSFNNFMMKIGKFQLKMSLFFSIPFMYKKVREYSKQNVNFFS